MMLSCCGVREQGLDHRSWRSGTCTATTHTTILRSVYQCESINAAVLAIAIAGA